MSGQYDRIILPGQSGKIPIKVSTGHATGQIAKSASVLTNVPGPGNTIALQIRGEIWQIIQATPNSALFGNVTASQIKEGTLVRKLTIVNGGDAPAKLTNVTSSNAAAFKGDLKELEPGKKWELTVSLQPTVTTGVQSAMIDVTTGVAEMPKLQISCSAYFVQEVDVIPNRMVLPAGRTVSMERDFIIRNNGAKPLKVTDPSATSPLIKLALAETQPGMSFRLSMTVPPEYKSEGKEGGLITFKTDNPGFAQVKIPINESSAMPAPNAQSAAINPRPTTQPAMGMVRSGALNPRPTTQPSVIRAAAPTFPGQSPSNPPSRP